MSARPHLSPHILFLGLETYGRIGGLQAFNRRLIAALADRARAAGAPPLAVVLRRDAGAALPDGLHARIRACDASLPGLLRRALPAARGAGVIVAGHVNLLPVAALCRIVAPGARLLLMAHGDEVWGDPAYRARRVHDRALMRGLTRVVAVSGHTARRMQAAFGLRDGLFRILPNAVDPLDFPLGPPEAEDAPAEILSVTRLAAHDGAKNIDRMLAAMALLAPARPGLRYRIVGEGVLRPGLEALAARLGIADRVVFAGRLSDADLAAAYGRARVFALPSAKEGFGIVYLEAWQRGLPVICGTTDAGPEIVGDGIDGFAVDPADPAALAARIGWLLDHPAAARAMGRAGRDKVAARYLMPAFRARLGAILDEVAG